MRIGIDLGGTKIELAALDADGRFALRQRLPTPRGDYDGTLDTFAELVSQAERVVGPIHRIGVATPGALSTRTGLLKNANSTVLNGHPLDRDLSARLRRPVRLENDANCLALSEAVDGAASGAGVTFGVVLGTGVGGGIVIGRTLTSGHNHIAGEWGHNPLPWRSDRDPAPAACYCGRAGCIETYLSGSGLQRTHQFLHGQALGVEAIAQAAQEGDSRAAQTLDLYTDQLSRALATVINVLDPDVIVLGGGLSNITSLYTTVPQKLPSYAFSDAVTTRLEPARFGDSSGVRGAAWLWE